MKGLLMMKNMSRSRFTWILLSALVILVSLGTTGIRAATAEILILHDWGPDARQPSLAEARYIANLTGHFKSHADILNITNYKAGLMRSYDAIFYISYEKKFALPEAFKSDFLNTDKTVCWLNRQLDEIDQTLLRAKFGFHVSGFVEDHGFTNVIYKDRLFPKGDDTLNVTGIDDSSIAHVVSFARNTKGEKLPYVIHSKNLWFIADSPFSYCSERDRYIVFADLMHDILGQDHPVSHTALVRIEDVNPLSDPASLNHIFRYLAAEKVPFAVSLVPVYIDPLKKIESHLEDHPALLRTLKRVGFYGGAIVMHGFTHQYRGVTTDDYEFWDDVEDRPPRGDSVEYTSIRIEKGLRELFQNNLVPFAWETPHYFGSGNTHMAVRKFFSHVWDRGNVMEYLGSDQFFPYRLRDIYGQDVIPENLGYVHLEHPDSSEILQAASLNLAVRDGYASFFFHPFVDISYLKAIVRGMKKMGYKFADIRSFKPGVTATDKAVLTSSQKITIESRDKYVSIDEFLYSGSRIKHQLFPITSVRFSKDLVCPDGRYQVVRTQEEPDFGLLVRLWKLAKRDLDSLNASKTHRIPYEGMPIQKIAFIVPEKEPSFIEEANDLMSLQFSLFVAGVPYTNIRDTEIPKVDIGEFDIIVLPFAAAKGIGDASLKSIKDAVNAGSRIVFDGVSRVADEFNIEFQQKILNVRQIRDTRFPDIRLYWPSQAQVRPVFRVVEKEYSVWAEDEVSGVPLVVSGAYGKGGFLFYSTLFDPESRRGTSRFPFFAETLDAVFNLKLSAERRTAEMYFDPGMRQFISIEKLAKIWREHGVKRIYAGGWHFYDKYSYDYARLVRVCHENGILVYCWLEPPMVSMKFWNKYPDWREKTADLKEAGFSWRKFMNLADPACRSKVFSETSDLLLKYDWDGVNLAELYFESTAGPERPDMFTPMNSTVRREYALIAGFDPIQLFDSRSTNFWKKNPAAWDKFALYRSELGNRLKLGFIDLFKDIRKKRPDFEIMFTAIDTTTTPMLAKNLGQDNDFLLEQARKSGITMQMEDPLIMWKGPPERYAALGKYYRKLVPEKNSLVLDCNVLENHVRGEGGFPAEKPTGEEIRQITYNMDLSEARPAFYSEDSINEFDYHNIAAVLARDTLIVPMGSFKWKIRTPYTISVLVARKDLVPYLDGDSWLAGEGNSVIIPAGEHVLHFEPEHKYFNLQSLKVKILAISGELKWATFQNRSVDFAYKEDKGPCYIILSKRPVRINIDNKRAKCPIYVLDQEYSIKLPGGEHVVKAWFGRGFGNLVESSGVVLLSLVIIFGLITSVMFLGLFIAIKIKRKIIP
jgi:uncharacterized protein YdaL